MPQGREAAPEPGFQSLTDREANMLVLIAAGRTDRQIAASLQLSENTVSTYVTRLLVKFGAANRAELTAKAFVSGLLTGAGLGRPPAWSGIRSFVVHW